MFGASTQPSQLKLAFFQHSQASTPTLVASSTNTTEAHASQTAGDDRSDSTSQAAGNDRGDRGKSLSELNRKNATLGSWLLKVAKSNDV